MLIVCKGITSLGNGQLSTLSKQPVDERNRFQGCKNIFAGYITTFTLFSIVPDTYWYLKSFVVHIMHMKLDDTAEIRKLISFILLLWFLHNGR